MLSRDNTTELIWTEFVHKTKTDRTNWTIHYTKSSNEMLVDLYSTLVHWIIDGRLGLKWIKRLDYSSGIAMWERMVLKNQRTVLHFDAIDSMWNHYFSGLMLKSNRGSIMTISISVGTAGDMVYHVTGFKRKPIYDILCSVATFDFSFFETEHLLSAYSIEKCMMWFLKEYPPNKI